MFFFVIGYCKLGQHYFVNCFNLFFKKNGMGGRGIFFDGRTSQRKEMMGAYSEIMTTLDHFVDITRALVSVICRRAYENKN